MKNMRKVVSIGVVLLTCGALMYFAMPIFVNACTSWQRYTQRVARQSDYTKITTPLSKSVVDDICSKFKIGRNDVRCLPDAIVYAPDFFGDIKTYLQRLPDQDATFEVVNKKLGIYLVRCNMPDKEGIYGCRYDIRGDGFYPIFVDFTKEGKIHRIFANTGGS